MKGGINTTVEMHGPRHKKGTEEYRQVRHEPGMAKRKGV